MERTTGYRSLEVWHRAMELAVESYDVVARLPGVERYNLGSQLRRSAVSVPANIAEGCARNHLGDYLQHLAIAAGSLAELETLLVLSEQLGYSTAEQLSRPLALAAETERMLHGLRRVLRGRRDRLVSLHTSRRRSS